MGKKEAVIIFTVGVITGFGLGKQAAEKEYKAWREEHNARCRKPQLNPLRPGDYPPIFVIETAVKEAK